MSRFGLWAPTVLVLLLAGCANRAALSDMDRAAVTSGDSLELIATPFFAQRRFQCGPAALATVLAASGVDVNPDQLVDQVYIPALKGSLQAEMLAAARNADRIAQRIPPQFQAITEELRAGRPVLVLLNLGWSYYPVWHYAVVVGLRPHSGELLLRSGETRRQWVAATSFSDDWNKAGRWAVVVLKPGELPASVSSQAYLAAVADVEEAGHIASARKAYRAGTLHWPRQAGLWLGLANTRYSQGEKHKAALALRRALEIDADEPVTLNNLAQVEAELGCRELALGRIERALQWAPASLRPAIKATREEILAMTNAGNCAFDPAAEPTP